MILPLRMPLIPFERLRTMPRPEYHGGLTGCGQ